MTAYAGEVRSNATRRARRAIETRRRLARETVGGIRLVRTSDQALVWQENTPLRPGCGNVAAVTAINDRYMALCGHLGGRHYTQKIIFTQDNSLSMVSVDQYDSPGPVRVEPNGSLAIDVLRRDLFPGELTGPHYFHTVYRLRHDDATFGFVPSFDGDAAERYWLHYRVTRQAAPAAECCQKCACCWRPVRQQSICAELDTLAADLQQGDSTMHKARAP